MHSFFRELVARVSSTIAKATIVGVASTAVFAQGAPCVPVKPSATYSYKQDAVGGAGQNNSGVVAPGFIGLDGNAEVIHGIDVSKYQDDADFIKVRLCGAGFSYVRLSGGTFPDNELAYRAHWANARAAGLIPGPYHNLSMLPVSAKSFVDGKSLSIDELVELGERSARSQARLFLDRLREVSSMDPRGNRDYLPVALDAGSNPIPESSAALRAQYAKVVSSMVCSWISEVHKNSEFDVGNIVLFTSPKVYADYMAGSSACELDKIPLWIRIRPKDGGAAYASPDEQAMIEKVCRLPDGTDRCVMQQYTSYGGFVAFDSNSQLDLNRFLGTKEDLRDFIRRGKRR